ncbi:bifunctional metallophosphatase/5'-nucleotidase [Polyangium aurulentum]|uniref:bifunctional metallophosphatase/5'-nucleotidase n=1 Tax=Polyangium aurulentum TaxID=2567896 RepID=UPI00146E4E72|nr:bifunctional metallophosphatase/5'-nucleotidase [Polyangium aurulentum]UQA58092.1 5'-nucleotidase C-terminal domain-containing protein [Polyangium aurulentum]
MRAVAVLLALLAAACGPAPAPSPLPSPAATAAAATPKSSPVTVTLLYTTDEHGWLEPSELHGKTRGGVAELLGRLVADEGHCPGPIPEGVDPKDALAPDGCARPRTLLLSNGDNFTGPAISTYFRGESMARAMARLGYAASAFGNHEFDFGRDQFQKLRDLSGVQYLAANLRIADPNLEKALRVAPFTIVNRLGIRIAVVGLAPADTLHSAMASRFEGITIEPTEPALGRAVDAAWTEGADTVVVAAHECPDVLAPIVARHPEWKLAFVGGGHCHKTMSERAGDVPVLAPTWRMHQYARVRLTVDPVLPPKNRVVSVEPSLVDVEPSPSAAPDPPLTRMVRHFKEEVARALGVAIGHAGRDIAPEENVGQMVADAWLSQMGGDVAIVNRGGIRQTIPAGTITHGTIWGVLPFDNRIVKVSLRGDDLVKDLEAMPKIIVAGAKKGAGGKWALASGKPIDGDHRYTVLVTDFMYAGGDGAPFAAQDPKPVETEVNWRDPVIAWIAKQQSTPLAPLEKKLAPRAR